MKFLFEIFSKWFSSVTIRKFFSLVRTGHWVETWHVFKTETNVGLCLQNVSTLCTKNMEQDQQLIAGVVWTTHQPLQVFLLSDQN